MPIDSNVERPNIYLYFDYRLYLGDMYKYFKATERGFSHRKFVQRAGMSAPNALARVIRNQCGLSEDTAKRFAQAFRLPAAEEHFFIHLVAWNQAKSDEEKQFHDRKLRKARKRFGEGEPVLDQYEYFAHWHTVAVRELLSISGAPQTAKDIARTMRPRISVYEAQDALDLLQRLGLVVQDGETYRATDEPVKTPKLFFSEAARNYYHQILRLAEDSIENIAVEERTLGGITLAIPEDRIEELFEAVTKARLDLFEQFATHTAEEKEVVYQIHFQTFPLSKSVKKVS